MLLSHGCHFLLSHAQHLPLPMSFRGVIKVYNLTRDTNDSFMVNMCSYAVTTYFVKHEFSYTLILLSIHCGVNITKSIPILECQVTQH